MDRIGMNLGTDAIRYAQAPITGSSGNIAPKEKIAEPQDKLDFNSGRVSLIMNADTPEALAELKEKVLQNPENKITADLPLINGFAVETNDPDIAKCANKTKPDSMEKLDLSSIGLMKGLEGSVNVWKDGRISIPEPVANVERPEANEKLDIAANTLGLNELWDKGITGKGTTICVIDTGMAQHPDYKDRIIGFKDFVNGKTEPYDDQGHGTHCTGITAGNGTASNGKYKGAAPEANLVGVKVLDRNGSGSFSDIIKGIQWAIENKEKFGIDVVSMSLGGPATQSASKDPVSLAAEKAVDAGLIMVVAAGNSGPGSGTIGTPANAENVITVGAMDDKGTLSRDDDTMAYFSSCGPTKYDGLVKPDIVAPGVNITSASNTGSGYVTMSGTSMATPLAAGVMALAAQVKPNVSPLELKEVAMKTADKLQNTNYTENQEGKGVVDPKEIIHTLAPQIDLD